jgi:hypothetical protein
VSKSVILDASVLVDGFDLSDHVQKVTVSLKKDVIDVTGIGDDSHRSVVGLETATFAVTFFQDFDAGNVDAVLEPLYAAGDAFPVDVAPTSAPASADNPSYSGMFILPEYTPLSGGIGDASMIDVTFQNA